MSKHPSLEVMRDIEQRRKPFLLLVSTPHCTQVDAICAPAPMTAGLLAKISRIVLERLRVLQI
ncbi:hypothetical protein ACUXAV_006173 [Cupriavidus metallidurans]|nr:hypothetical protein D769_20639 [Cupriavidus sp. HMR-1]KWR85458.1 hypothetical protein RN01_05405 [Cupriavidus sp. SHE]